MQTGGGERSVSHHWEIVKCTYMCVHVHTHTHTCPHSHVFLHHHSLPNKLVSLGGGFCLWWGSCM